LTSFLKHQQRFSEYVDPDEGNGELTIFIPKFLQQQQEQNSSITTDDNNTNDIVYKVTIDFSLEQPESGIHFFIPDDDAKLSRVSLINKLNIYKKMKKQNSFSLVVIYLQLVMMLVFGFHVLIVIVNHQHGQLK
jgi:hypothetical protein